MSTNLADLAELVGCRLIGAGDTAITGAATLNVVTPGQITLADDDDHVAQLAQSSAAAAVVATDVECAEIPVLVVDDAHAAFAKIVTHFRPHRSNRRLGVSPNAFISPTAKLGEDVDVHPGATIGDDVVIGDGSTIHSGVHIMVGTVIGRGVTLFPNAVVYEETQIGDRSIIHAGAVLGSYGFGYREVEGRHELSAQVGYVDIRADVEIGACATIDRGTYGPTVIGAGTKIDNLVQVAHNCRLGEHNLICSQVGIAGSTTTGDYVVMAGQVGVRDHVHIGERAVICSKAGVSNNVDDGAVMLGQPATPVRKQKLQVAAISKLPEMRRQFRELQRQLAKLQQKIDNDTTPDCGDQAA